ncbi:MAG: terminase small subunit [Oscillospiraceae bacterium]|nr:terminase small subunit [Oscillospiraceae bacterium]
MIMAKPALDIRERRFCYYMARLQNPEEAAVRAGYRAGDAPDLLDRVEVRRHIGAWQRRLAGGDVEYRALAGLCRVAFGPAQDAVKLAFTADGDGEAEHLFSAFPDLYCVSELKRQKGGVELKLADRSKALEALLRWSRERKSGKETGKSLISALERSVTALESPVTHADDVHD